MTSVPTTEAITGCLLGTAVGDAYGLPFEGLNRNRIAKVFKDKDKYHFIAGLGMVSDDTEHACFVAQAFINSCGNCETFASELGTKLRLWFLSLPAGIGLATLRACIKLCLGFSTQKSGVFSAGNGPAMRSPLLGVLFANNSASLIEHVKRSTLITHTDPKAYYGAMAVALAAKLASTKKGFDHKDYLTVVDEYLDDEANELKSLLQDAATSVEQGETTAFFAERLGLSKGITGYMYHTVPVVIHCWLSNPFNYKQAMEEIVGCGGDTDTTAAILGAIIGAGVGKAGIPGSLIATLGEWPRTTTWMENLAEVVYEVANGKEHKAPNLPALGIVARNALFTVLVLLHGFRRLLPPY